MSFGQAFVFGVLLFVSVVYGALAWWLIRAVDNWAGFVVTLIVGLCSMLMFAMAVAVAT